MAKHKRRVLVGADLEDILDAHFKEIVAALPTTFDVVERYSMRIARLTGPDRDLMVDEFRAALLALLRTEFIVALRDGSTLSATA